MKKIDEELYEKVEIRYQEIKKEYSEDPFCYKYMDIPLSVWLSSSMPRVEELGLLSGEKKHLLDIGSGIGCAPALAKSLGHSVLATDIYEKPFDKTTLYYSKIIQLFDLDYKPWRVERFEKCPYRGPFDVISSYCGMFPIISKNPTTVWGNDEWDFFLNDLKSITNPGGLILLNPNEICRTEDVKSYLATKGDYQDGKIIICL
jgi:cyclopropane fatty-acyl-phospholipid synthase-like methyltransferase